MTELTEFEQRFAEAERLLCDEKWQVDDRPGQIYRVYEMQTVPLATWFMMRSILVGMGYAGQIRDGRE